jgi:hypothetical protein
VDISDTPAAEVDLISGKLLSGDIAPLEDPRMSDRFMSSTAGIVPLLHELLLAYLCGQRRLAAGAQQSMSRQATGEQ